jgi:shikimate kinase
LSLGPETWRWAKPGGSVWQAAKVTAPEGAAHLGPQRVVLVGMMGAGKSTVARLLAEAFGCPAFDTDEMVERRVGSTVAQMFAEEGEGAFRAAESRAIGELGSFEGPLVASVGGGAVLSEANRAALRSVGTVVWLRALPATLSRRVGRGTGRPLLKRAGSGPLEALAQIAEERRALYQEVADLVVDVDGLSSRQVARELLTLLAPV